MIAYLTSLLRTLLRRSTGEREMREEMKLHLERATERYVARGMSLDEARLAARREFGNVRVQLIALLVCATSCAAPAAQTPLCTGVSCPSAERVWTETEVTRKASPLRNNPMPRPTNRMLDIWQPQTATVRFVVDTMGAVERPTLHVVGASDRDWAQALYDAVPRWKFEPAESDGKKVRQFVEGPVEWRPGSQR